ncbi:hypothetical protein [Ktedonobacter robiniae]|uniref:SMODS and SLOG-associating 2TM effector domain-containing protein n=1 Tax=Ktedonobacter robiniae TaxID=2778365 RepID=A0ABQ3UR83_9CHLR|nr:hypothetical protein [Ktedonobacter robiniae]GHO55294.1 hypothetical protein KSB_37690 [Ktedonobacter robiniae]
MHNYFDFLINIDAYSGVVIVLDFRLQKAISYLYRLRRDRGSYAEYRRREREEIFRVANEIGRKKYEYRMACRPLIWFRNFIVINFLIFITAIIIWGIAGENTYISGWCQAAIWISGLFIVILVFHFFNVRYHIMSGTIGYDGEKFGFKGIEKIQKVNSLKDEMEALEIQSRMLKAYQTSILSISEQLELYKEELLQAIQKYQRQASSQSSLLLITG